MSVFDLSRWQPIGRIRELVAQGNCDGVILKIGESTELDPKFLSHLNEAVDCGIPYGIYIMSRATNQDEILEEAKWLNDMTAEYLNGIAPSCGTWFDLERPQVKRANMHEDILAGIHSLQEMWHGNQTIGIYASYSYFLEYLDLDDLAEENIPIWLAQYGNTNSLQEKHNYPNIVAWQFTTNNNTQDENVWFGFHTKEEK